MSSRVVGQACGLVTVVASGLLSGVARADGGELLIDAIDVEGGAATLYITPEHQSLLIDTGWPGGMGAKDPDSAQRIIAAARRHGLTRLDYVLVTHYHVDHVGGLPELLSQFPVGTILDHGQNREAPPADLKPAFAAAQPATLYPKYLEAIHGHEHRSLKPGDTLEIGSLRLTVVTSDGVTLGRPLDGAGATIADCDSMKPMAQDGGAENARSVGILMTFGQARIAALGDLTWNMEKELVCPHDKVGQVDLLIVSHHGSNLSSSPALLRALAPRVAIEDNGPRKGGDGETYETVAHSPRLARLWQLHLAEGADAQHNVPEAYIANPSSTGDMRVSIEASVTKQGAIAVTNDRTGSTERYPPAAAVAAAPDYRTIKMEIDINKPAAEVWAKVGGYCDISKWFDIDCQILSGDGGVGTVRSLAKGRVLEVLVGKTDLSYGYAQPAKEGAFYNLYHGFMEAKPVGRNKSKIVYTLLYDVSEKPDDAAKEADLSQRRARFEAALKKMKQMAEG